MNARRRTRPDGLPSRVYKKCGSFYWVHAADGKNIWIKLCRVEDGESRMLERLAEETRKAGVDGSEGSLSRLVAIYMQSEAKKYADSFRDEWKRRGEDVCAAFKAFDIQQVDAGLVEDFLLHNWADKLPTQKVRLWTGLSLRRLLPCYLAPR